MKIGELNITTRDALVGNAIFHWNTSTL